MTRRLELHTILTAPQCFKLHLPALNSTLLSSFSLPLPYYVSLLPNSSHFSSSKPNPETEAQIPTQIAGLLTLYHSPRMHRNKKAIKSAEIIHKKTEAIKPTNCSYFTTSLDNSAATCVFTQALYNTHAVDRFGQSW